MQINKDTINNYSYIAWHKNTGNFNGKCQCDRQIKVGDTILLEADTSNGLTMPKYCITCGNKRIKEYVDYYTSLLKEGK